MTHELIFEIGTEEIPAGYINPSLENLRQALKTKLTDLSLTFGAVKGAATPRRIAVCVEGLEERQPDRQETVMGPPQKAAFDQDGKPTKAAIGFAQSRGASVEDIQIANTPKGDYVMLELEQKGKSTKSLLPKILSEIITGLSFKKSMRWGTGQMHFVRPIQWILATYGGEIIDHGMADLVKSGRTTRGHRFHAPGTIEVESFSGYLEGLRKAHIIADPAERRQAVAEGIAQATAKTGGTVLDDQELLDTVTNLVESPHAVCGTFEERFLELPREVLITSMREHQKYFAVINDNGELMPHFVAVNNTQVKDEAITTAGHERVLRARLEDAFFFFREDQNKKLSERVEQLSGVIFQAKLGTMLEKTNRVEKLTGFLADKLAPESKKDAQRAARLAKADLITDMVGEFPSLQGTMGRDYALKQGENVEVATAIHQHYLPLRAGGELPKNKAGIILGMADRLDTIAGCFGIDAIPTGSADPFGLRRLSLALLHIIQDQSFTLSLSECTAKALELYGDKIDPDPQAVNKKIMNFIKGRFTNDLTGQGIPIEAVEAITSSGFDDVVDSRRKVDALMTISDQPAFTVLAGSFKRVRNIIKKHSATEVDESLLEEGAEKELFAALQNTTAQCEPFLQKRDYDQALLAILAMKEPVDKFFDDVMVMADDQNIRNNRLALLTGVSKLFLRIGDFSRMFGMQAKTQTKSAKIL